ncbi:hypothetical protein Sgou_01980 [Streptomyces gougerotii]|uniref:Uncharacterized protein n=2 Tax=Streptomyces diastaticus group TaxID=2849069 RepID=A0A8H9HUI8_9ACTN|nr:hypothetical protein Srut_03280 [Streptomyces rutgersensis]GFH74977.1 hypothetical protein Sdia_57450 [Streptomyces diastaticus subsp. diastaticus]GFH75528.1 hypothetical protein Sgou_01980 [Streptomyces gougerotii]GGU40409.1 hypothetical protein GCM10015534_48950 [Streptomyces diastaticus subsp. diastaticus]GGU88869.1 hypothetical protein GCM10010227_49690 [Streptomyces gougerotii]
MRRERTGHRGRPTGCEETPRGASQPRTAPGDDSRRTGRKPEYVRYESFRQACREHAPDTAATAQDGEDAP